MTIDGVHAPLLATTDLSDEHPEAQVCDPIFRSYGRNAAFAGPIATLKVFEDNPLEGVVLAGRGVTNCSDRTVMAQVVCQRCSSSSSSGASA